MTTIYLIRHGESEGNKIRSFLGHTDLPLTEKGHLQADMTAQYLKNIGADVIYSSDLLRAYQTACHTADILCLPVIKNQGVREIFAGQWEGQLFDDLMVKYEKSYGVWKNDIGHACPDGGESVAHLSDRVFDTLTEIAGENDGKTVFVFAHATPIRTFAARCLGKSLDELKELPWPTNASVTRVIYDGSFTLTDYSIDSFMGELSTALPKNV